MRITAFGSTTMRSSTPLTPLVLPRGESAMSFKILSRVNLFTFFPQAGAVFGCFVTSLGSDRADRRFHNSSREAPQGCANVSGGTISCHIDTFVDRLAGLYFSAVLRARNVAAFSIQLCRSASTPSKFFVFRCHCGIFDLYFSWF